MTFQLVIDSIINLAHFDLILMLFIGVIAGLVFGALPGLSSITGMAIVLPFTFGMNPLAAMLIYAGIISVAPLGGSIPAILLNTPGTAPNAASCFDGFPMTQKGEGSRAIAVSSMSCLVGTIFGVVVLIILLNFIIPIILSFRAPEMFWLIFFGLMVISIVVKGSVLKGLSTAGIGILFSFVGINETYAEEMFTFNIKYLWDGIPLVPFYIGLFALSELIIYTAKGGTIVLEKNIKREKTNWDQIKQGILDVIKRPFLVFQSSVIGTGIGLLPGVGGTVSAFISYAMAKKSSKFPETFGKGNVEGLIATEVANDAKEGGSLLPTVAFGIPGSADMAIVLGAFVLHGLEPGPLLVRDHIDVVLTLALGLSFSQVIGSFLVFLTANYITRLVSIDTRILAPYVIILCLGGAFTVRGSYLDVILAIMAGFLGYFMKIYKFPVVPMAIGYILGDMAQKTFHQSLMMSFGKYDIFFSSKICFVIIFLIIVLLTSTYFKTIFFKRSK